jgi:hypothetical protein
MSNPNPLPDPEQLTADLHAWMAHWEGPLAKWLSIYQAEDPASAKLLEPVLELLRLLVNLLKDPALPDGQKETLVETALYVLNGRDLLPEDEMGATGLMDDAVRMAQYLEPLIGRYTHLLKNNWSGGGDILEVIDYLVEHGGSLGDE